MKPAAFDYRRPETIADAASLLGQGDGGAMAIAGGQSLLVLMGLRFTLVDTLVDLSRLDALRRVEEKGDGTFIGAGITHAMIEDGKIADPSQGLMPRVAAKIAYRAVRNLGTIGGSVALADPAADWPACLIALDAVAVIASADGERREQVESLIRGPYETSLAGGEIIKGFEIARLSAPAWGTAKVQRKSGAFADSMTVVVDRAAGRARSRAVVSGTSSHARPLPRVCAWLDANEGVDVAAIAEAVRADIAELDPMADGYQTRCHVATVTRAITEART